MIEPLELRIAPATLVNPTTVTFTDVDGDLVTVKVTEGTLDLDANFIFAAAGAGEQLQLLNLTDAEFEGTNVTITAKRQAVEGGDGYVNIGAISAAGRNLGAVRVGGDLGQIDAGSNDASTPALKKLTLGSLAELGLSTQGAGGDLLSNINGDIGTVSIIGNLRGFLHVAGEHADIRKVTIGGSLMGGTEAFSGRIEADGDLASLTIGGGVHGGSGADSATVDIVGAIGKLSVAGTVDGSTGDRSAFIDADEGIGSVKIGGSVIGGAGFRSGIIDGSVSLGPVRIGGSLVGGEGEDSGSILAESDGGSIKSVTVGYDVRGGGGDWSAYIHAGQSLGSVKVGGSVLGGQGILSGSIYAGSIAPTATTMKSVTIAGDLVGGDGTGSGSIGASLGVAGSMSGVAIGKVAVQGSVIGGGSGTGTISGRTIASVTIGGDLAGGESTSANIRAGQLLEKVTIAGSVLGGTGAQSGVIAAPTVGTVKLGGNLQGGSGNYGAAIGSDFGGLQSVSIGGNVLSGTGDGTGAIYSFGALGKVNIVGSVLGRPTEPVFIMAHGVSGEETPLAIGKVTIKGNAEFLRLLAGYGDIVDDPTNPDASIGKVTIGGDFIASSIVAGVDSGIDGVFGTTDDALGLGGDDSIVARIASVAIKGQAFGTGGGTDHFGIVAEEIVKLKIGAVKYPLTSEVDILTLGATGDLIAREDVRMLEF